MLRLSALSLAILLLLQLPVAAAQSAPAVGAAEQTLAGQIDASLARHYPANAPGATVLVLKDGKTVLRKAYGLANVQANTPMTADMSLRIGSITKQFTAVAIMMLVEDGKLKLSDDITKFLPDYPTRGKKITLEHLLTHTSGIVSYTGKPGFTAIINKDMPLAALIDTFKNDPLEFEPGSKFAYNNSGYVLLGAIIEKLSGQPYADFVAQRIFVPTGMTQTAYEGHERTPPRRAPGYGKKDGIVVPAMPMSMTLPHAAGALVSTVDDLGSWDTALQAGKLISKASLAKVNTPYRLSDGKSTGYGYGWGIATLQGRPAISHGGGINGYRSYAVRLSDDKLYVALLTNTEAPAEAPDTIATRVAALAVGKPFPTPLATKPDGKSLDALVGVYTIDAKHAHIVRRVNDQLTIQGTGRDRAQLVPYSPTGFFIAHTLIMVEFEKGPDGQVKQLKIQDGIDNPVHVRSASTVPELPSVKVPAAVLDTYVGRYPMPPGFTIAIARDGEKMLLTLTGQPTLELFASDPANFFVKEVDAKFRFEKTADGVQQLVMMQHGHTLTGKRE